MSDTSNNPTNNPSPANPGLREFRPLRRGRLISYDEMIAESEAEMAARAVAAQMVAARKAAAKAAVKLAAEVAAAAESASEVDVGEAIPAATGDAAYEVDGNASLAPLPLAGRGEAPERCALPPEVPGQAREDESASEPADANPDPEPALDLSDEPDPELAGWTPPPRKARKVRHDEWTRQKMALFLRELAASQSVAQAARSVGMSRQSAYRLRARLVGTPFAFGWEVALEAGLAQLAHAMMDRAVNGVEVPHYHAGELVGTSRRYDERLSVWLMSNPWKVGRQQIAREYSAEGFDRLLERIETGPLDWEGLDEPGEERDEEAREGGGAPPDQLPGLLPPAPSAGEAGERQGAFMMTRSWYGAGAGEESRDGQRGWARGRGR